MRLRICSGSLLLTMGFADLASSQTSVLTFKPVEANYSAAVAAAANNTGAGTTGRITADGAYSLNATVVPEVHLGYLSLWPSGQAQPFVSTLNAPDDAIVANAAIVPVGTGGAVSAYATERTHLIIDTNGYFAP